MPLTFTCSHCGQTALQNIRLKKLQQYCSQSGCQKARRRAWKKNQYHKNEEYRKRCLADQKKWRQSYPADQYQKNYRGTHPEYVLRNRELQRQRNRSRSVQLACTRMGMGGEASHTAIIKKDSLVFHPGEDGKWFLSQTCEQIIVNRNALPPLPGTGVAFALTGIQEAKIVNRNALTASGP